MKLNLGCRNRPIPGFKGMDIDAHPSVDFIGNVADLSRFKDGEIEEIYASHVLEHFLSTKTFAVLQEWFRVLAPGGKLHVGVPDFAKVCAIYQKSGLTPWLREYVWGGQEYKTAFHYTGFDESYLTGLLQAAGFSQVLRADYFGMSPTPDCSDLTVGYTMEDGSNGRMSVSLNLIGIK